MQSGNTPDTNDYYNYIQPPKVEDMEVQLQQLVQQGVLNPEEAATILQDPSAMNNISTDPSLKRNQMDALLGLQEISDSGGMTNADMANLSKIQNQEDTTAQGKREAIIQNAEARGLGGSGLELMSQMQNQQDSATRQSQRDMDVAGQAQQRALEALMQQGQLAGQIQNQDFGQQASVANANDAISRFNAQNKQGQINTNVGARNAAQAGNLASKQGVANANVDTANAQQMHNKALIQQDYENKMKKASGQTGVAQNNANAQGKNSQSAADAYNKSVGAGMSAIAMMSDERQKENIEDFDAADFLDSITGHKYNYKDPKFGSGKKAGVMAQDLEKTDIGSQLVQDTPEGKVVDYAKAGPTMMASLAHLNERLKKLEGGGESDA